MIVGDPRRFLSLAFPSLFLSFREVGTSLDNDCTFAVVDIDIFSSLRGIYLLSRTDILTEKRMFASLIPMTLLSLWLLSLIEIP